MAHARARQDKPLLEQLKDNDRVLSQYQLEDESRTNIFDWIRDFKDFEIREDLKTQIRGLQKSNELKDQEILALQLRLDDIPTLDNSCGREHA